MKLTSAFFFFFLIFLHQFSSTVQLLTRYSQVNGIRIFPLPNYAELFFFFSMGIVCHVILHLWNRLKWNCTMLTTRRKRAFDIRHVWRQEFLEYLQIFVAPCSKEHVIHTVHHTGTMFHRDMWFALNAEVITIYMPHCLPSIFIYLYSVLNSINRGSSSVPFFSNFTYFLSTGIYRIIWLSTWSVVGDDVFLGN